jgi:23S rRNA pseudouridine1911/1915/1917 synthase
VEQRVIVQVDQSGHKLRLEDFLLDRFRNLSKMYLREIVKRELCEVNGRAENVGYRVRANDLIEIILDPDRETAMLSEEMPLQIIYEDASVIVVDKPAGMLVHPSHRENRGTLLNGLSHHLNHKAGPDAPHLRPGLPHRLDKQTSGLIAVAKNARAHRLMSSQFMSKRVEKRYIARVEGIVQLEEGVITGPIGRYEELKHWSIKADGKHSESRYRVIQLYADSTLIEMEPVTGRTNQLRIHCEHLGHPIIGDVSRGGREFSRLCLHACRLGFVSPDTNEWLAVESPTPAEFLST